jgi:hypothetical protein
LTTDKCPQMSLNVSSSDGIQFCRLNNFLVDEFLDIAVKAENAQTKVRVGNKICLSYLLCSLEINENTMAFLFRNRKKGNLHFVYQLCLTLRVSSLGFKYATCRAWCGRE